MGVSLALQLPDLGSIGSSPVAGWIGIGGSIVAVIGVLLSVYFYRKSRRFKRPVYVLSTQNVIQDYSARLQDLQVSFKGKSVGNVSVTKVGIWNDGTETINKSDIADADPLRITLAGTTELLDATVVKTTSPACQFEIITSGKNVTISFDYLDKTKVE